MYWHGVTLPIESWALANGWPLKIATDLAVAWNDGPSLYDRVRTDILAQDTSDTQTLRLGDYVMRPAPRATKTHLKSHTWSAYTPTSPWTDTHRSNLPELVDRERVTHLLVDKGTAIGCVGVDRAGGKQVRMADKIVLAAGTVENSRLVIQAHRPGDRHRECGGLSDHISHGIVAVGRPQDVSSQARALADTGSIFYSTFPPPMRSNLFLQFRKNPRNSIIIEAWMLGEQLPDPRNLIRCRPRSNDHSWETTISAQYTEADLVVIGFHKEILSCFWRTVEAEMLAPNIGRLSSHRIDTMPESPTLAEVSLNVETQDANAEAKLWAGYLGSEYHEGCTMPLGRVLDDSHQSLEVDNLYVLGPCSFPRLGAANPTLTTIALSRRLSRILLK